VDYSQVFGSEGQAMIVVCLAAAYGLLQAYFGIMAGEIMGYPMLWVPAFLFLPGISHLYFLFLCINKERRARAFKVINNIFRPRVRWLDAQKPSEKPVEVTPFDGPVVVDESERTIRPPILDKCQDEDLENLIAWREWIKARSLAVERLEQARENNLPGSVVLYEAYLKLIDPAVTQNYCAEE
jgi:hypothetical protein